MSHTPNTAFHQMSQMQKERDTYRDLCGELLEALKAQDALSKKGLLGAKLGEIPAVDSMRKSAITKAEKIMGDSNG